MKRLLAATSFIIVGVLMSVPTIAHHSTADYETKLTTVTGTITDYRLMNPHTQIFFDVKGDKGNVEKWVAETNSAVALYRTGWTKKYSQAWGSDHCVGKSCHERGYSHAPPEDPAERSGIADGPTVSAIAS